MPSKPSLKKNLAYSMAYQVLTLIVPFVTTPYISRVLGSENIGIYSYTSSIMAICTLFAALGTINYGTREIARLRDDKQAYSAAFWGIEIVTVIASLICLAFWLTLSFLYEEYRVYLLALTPTLLSTLLDISWFFTGHEQLGKVVIRNSAVKISCIILMFVLVKTESDLIAYMLMISTVQLAGNATMWSYLPSMVLRVPLSDLNLSRHFKQTIEYFIPAVTVSVYIVLDKTMIGLILGNMNQSGYYEQSSKMISMAKTISFTALNTVMSARLSYLFAHQMIDEFRKRLHFSMSLTMLLAFGLCFGIAAVAQVFVPLFFGHGYEEVTPLLWTSSGLIVVTGISGCLCAQYFIPAGLIRKSTRAIIAGAVLNVVVNLAAIPFLGCYGAIVGAYVGEGIKSYLHVRWSDNYYTFLDLWKASWKKLLAGLAMLALIMFIGMVSPFVGLVTLLVQVILGTITFALILLMLRDDGFIVMWKKVRVAINNRLRPSSIHS